MPTPPPGYQAIRSGCALLIPTDRATIRVEGADRHDFLNRMLTQAVSAKALPAGRAARAFWLNRKGRIEADLRILSLPDQILLETDQTAAASALRSLQEFLFTEDVRLTDASTEWSRLSLHGPTAPQVLASALELAEPLPIAPDDVRILEFRAVQLLLHRQDAASEPGLEIHIAPSRADGLRTALLSAGATPVDSAAFDTARIEAGWPRFGADFDTDSLPHETGVLRDRVSFTKGCYLGQEVVARMESLGQPKQVLVSLSLEPVAPSALPAQGDPVLLPGLADPIGRITSAAFSPALGGAPIAFAQVRTKHAAPGSRLVIDAPGAGATSALVNPSLSILGVSRAGV